jgi:Rap1a immunity proteins
MFQAIPIVRGIVLIAVLIGGSVIALAEEDRSSADHRMRGCRLWIETKPTPIADDLEKGICFGVVMTLVEDYLNKDFCIYMKNPTELGPTNGQFLRVVVQYIDGRPGRLHEDFHNLAHEALRVTWPCKPKA